MHALVNNPGARAWSVLQHGCNQNKLKNKIDSLRRFSSTVDRLVLQNRKHDGEPQPEKTSKYQSKSLSIEQNFKERQYKHKIIF